MNNVVLFGRLTKDPEVKYTQGENAMATCRFTVAVQRDYKNKEGKYEADFISCQTFSHSAEFLGKYFKKGDAIGVRGAIRTGSYVNKDGVTVYTTDVNVDKIEFGGGKSSADNGNSAAAPASNDGFFNVPEDTDEILPFN